MFPSRQRLGIATLVAPFAKLNTFQVSGSSNPNLDLGDETAPPAATESHLSLLREEKHCDVTFVVGPSKERIQCHQIFLKARSTVFETMFSERWSEGSSEIQIPDVDPKTFRALLEFVYTDKFTASASEALNLLYVGHKYEVDLLVYRCDQLLQRNLNLGNSISVFQVARNYGRAELMKKAGDLMAESFEALANDLSSVDMDNETLMYLLEQDDLKVKEVDLFKIVVKWGLAQGFIREGRAAGTDFMNTLRFIRFPVMELNEFTEVVVPTGLLPESVSLQLFIYFGSDKTAQKKLRKTLAFSAVPRAGPAARDAVYFYDRSNTTEDYSVPVGRHRLRDAVGFQVLIADGCRGRASSFRLVEQSTKVAIKSVILQCPITELQEHNHANAATNNSSFVLAIRREETVGLHGNNVYSELFKSKSRFAWGTEMEVEVKPPVQLRSGNNYRIIIQNEQGNEGEKRCRKFGRLKSAVEFELSGCTLRIQNFNRNFPHSGQSRFSLIHGVQFVEL